MALNDENSILLWVLTLGFGVRFLSTIRGLKRKYEEKAEVKLSISSFYDRFTLGMADFLHRCVRAPCDCVSSTDSNPVVFWAIT